MAISPSSSEGAAVYRFAAFEADFRTFELRKHGLKVKVQQQPLQILQALLERRGELVTREELRQKLWPKDLYLDFERNLTSAINKLRAPLNDSAGEPRYTETLSRRGYRFTAMLERVSITPVPGNTDIPSEPFPGTAAASEGGDGFQLLEPRHSQTDRSGGEAMAPIRVYPGAVGDGRAEPPRRDRLYIRWPRWLWASFILAVAAVTSFFIFRKPSRPQVGPPVPAGPVRIAVLPFVNLTGNSRQEYLCDSMTEEMITTLGSLTLNDWP